MTAQTQNEAWTPTGSSNPVFKHGDAWGFWNETWTECSYGYGNELDARLACLAYSEAELEGKTVGVLVDFWRLRARPFIYGEELPKLPDPNTCNIHNDCAAANAKAVANGKLWADHCHNDCCEDCFGQ